MAKALRSSQPVRGARAVAERPDGCRAPFMPFPTPLFDDEDRLIGGINLLLELSPAEWRRYLQSRAQHWRRVALSVSEAATSGALEQLARDYEGQMTSWAGQV